METGAGGRLVQITKRQGRFDRVKRDVIPVVELMLSDDERIIEFMLEPTSSLFSERKTVDWTWRATIEHRL